MNHTNSPTLKRSLSLKYVVFFGLAFMAPTTLFATYGVAVQSTNGMISTAYMIALLVMLFTAYSYAQMVKAFPTAGGAYTFTQKSFSPHVGFMVGWTILLDYVFSPMITSLFLGIAMRAYFPSIPMYIWIILFIIIITTVNILGITLAAKFNTGVLLLQFGSFILFILFSIKGLLNGQGAGTILSVLPFIDSNSDMPEIMSIIPVLCFSFLGFDAVTTLAEETKNPEKSIPKAIYLITIIGGVLYILGSYFLQLAWPEYQTFNDPEASYIEIGMYIGGNFLVSYMLAEGTITCFGSAIASGASASRILYAMGRDGVLPAKIFGYLSPKYRTPVFNLLIIGSIAFCSLFLSLTLAVSLINFGALLTFTLVNLSVIAHYYFRKNQRSIMGTIRYLIIPLIGASLTGLFFLKLDSHSLIVGGIWFALGFIYLLNLTKMFRQPPPELNFEEAQ
ncbi:MAG TPA: amino acid permease [Bacillus bacterium]|uniref:APC family permease n=1 Tax=Siminovitchia fordii TaxID=254759 RepID=UPI00035F5982|nr:APC family permease [Siminovitchia fordii]HBZ08861.1 amino acid permease [Bacillus sp. (in: firmicutes)]